MKKCLLLALFAIGCVCLSAGTVKVSLEQLNKDGWMRYKGQAITITTPLVVCGTMYDSLILSEERLFVPEEKAVGLAQGDSTEYWRLVNYNQQHRIKLECRYPFSLNLGATVKNLTARVMGERHLQTGAQPRFKNYKPSKKLPNMKEADVVICAANIQNYFVHVGGYATRRNTVGQHALQCYKVASALTRFNADIYTICELEQGDAAPAELVAKMNELCGKDRYAFVLTDTCDRDTISVGFLYRKDKVRPYGALRFAYHAEGEPTQMLTGNIYAHRFMLQGWQDIATGERFTISLNHPRSKRGDPHVANEKRMANSHAILDALEEYKQTETDPDYLLLGDYNAYAQEQPLQTIVEAGYQDINSTMAPNNYSYSYKGECGYLDRCYASPSMAAQIVAISPIHWNTDYYYSAAYYSKYNYKNREIPKLAPKKIRSVMSPAAKKNRYFRYSDHDPLLIGIKF
ncbi:MAG: hypothetical protein KBS69_06320 [Bacteroidales bacterium]|nr:hypothetical protein [Candidatus Colicola caccequi]